MIKRYTVFVFDKDSLMLKDYFHINGSLSFDQADQVTVLECIERGYNNLDFNIHLYSVNDCGSINEHKKYKMEDF